MSEHVGKMSQPCSVVRPHLLAPFINTSVPPCCYLCWQQRKKNIVLHLTFQGQGYLYYLHGPSSNFYSLIRGKEVLAFSLISNKTAREQMIMNKCGCKTQINLIITLIWCSECSDMQPTIHLNAKHPIIGAAFPDSSETLRRRMDATTWFNEPDRWPYRSLDPSPIKQPFLMPTTSKSDFLSWLLAPHADAEGNFGIFWHANGYHQHPGGTPRASGGSSRMHLCVQTQRWPPPCGGLQYRSSTRPPQLSQDGSPRYGQALDTEAPPPGPYCSDSGSKWA